MNGVIIGGYVCAYWLVADFEYSAEATANRHDPLLTRWENQVFHLLQLRGVLVNIGGGEDEEDGGAGDSTNVSQTFQPAGLFSLSNSP
jgi:hypothetical protein